MTDGLRAVRSSLAGIADALAAHLPPRYAPQTPAPAEDLAALLARAEDFYRTALAFASHDDPALSGVAAMLGSAYQVVRASSGDARTAARLVNSVLRPLAGALPAPPPAAPSPPQEPHIPQEPQKSQASPASPSPKSSIYPKNSRNRKHP